VMSPPAWEAWIETLYPPLEGGGIRVASRMGGVD